MENQQDYSSITRRLDRLEKYIFGNKDKQILEGGKKDQKSDFNSPTGGLQFLWEEGVFKDWRKISDVVKKLSDKGYNFSLRSIDMALQRAKYLTRKGRRGKYEYGQKYPYFKKNDNHEL